MKFLISAAHKPAAISISFAVLLSGCEANSPTVKEANAMQQTQPQPRATSLTEEWDKKFAKSDQVDHQKVTFKNRYGITLAADLYVPKNRAAIGCRHWQSAGRSAR
jgi:hypothetical protein